MEGPDVGALTRLKVFLDSKGIRPAWHLDYIEISLQSNNTGENTSKYVFPCGKWFDKINGLMRELVVAPSESCIKLRKKVP